MGRYTGPVCRICRREGMQLFLKGDRCFMAKCPVQTGRPAPGMHGQRRRKLTEYGAMLREKQRLRRTYGLQEEQFRVYFERALRRRGVTADALLQMLELRLDTVVRRLGFAPSQRAARQLVLHGHVRVNGRKVDIPSFILKPGNVVEVKSADRSRAMAKRHIENAVSRGIPPWLSLSPEEFRGVVKHVPSREEIAPVVNVQRVVELYSK